MSLKKKNRFIWKIPTYIYIYTHTVPILDTLQKKQKNSWLVDSPIDTKN